MRITWVLSHSSNLKMIFILKFYSCGLNIKMIFSLVWRYKKSLKIQENSENRFLHENSPSVHHIDLGSNTLELAIWIYKEKLWGLRTKPTVEKKYLEECSLSSSQKERVHGGREGGGGREPGQTNKRSNLRVARLDSTLRPQGSALMLWWWVPHDSACLFPLSYPSPTYPGNPKWRHFWRAGVI
jgi:hypothetical protein